MAGSNALDKLVESNLWVENLLRGSYKQVQSNVWAIHGQVVSKVWAIHKQAVSKLRAIW